MLRENFTGYRLYRSISILLGFMMMLTPVFFDQNDVFYLTPFGSLFLYIYVIKATGKFSISFLIFLVATLGLLVSLSAQEGELDLSFNGNGKYILLMYSFILRVPSLTERTKGCPLLFFRILAHSINFRFRE